MVATTSGLCWTGDVTALVTFIRRALRLKDARRYARPRDKADEHAEEIVVAVALATMRDMAIDARLVVRRVGHLS